MPFFLIFLMLTVSCGLSPVGNDRAIMDEHYALGMIVGKQGGVKMLKMVICGVRDNLPPTEEQLTQESICKNAFVDAEGNEYYFSELANNELKRDTAVKGYLKLGALLLVPVVIGVVIGFNAKLLISKLKIIITDDFKVLRDRGSQNTDLARKAKEEMYEMLNRENDTTIVGAGAGLIMSIVGNSHLRDHVWGKGERKTFAYWKDIFKVHNYRGSLPVSATHSWDISLKKTRNKFEDATPITDKNAIRDVLQTIAVSLGIEINPALNFRK